MRHNTAPTAPFLRSLRHTLALLLTGISLTLWAGHTEEPSSVTVAGDLQSELGCPGDWQPDCAATHLAYDAEDEVWQGIFNVPAGNWQYKAPLNDAWDENYGLGAVRDGPNIPLNLAANTDVKFFYDHETHWITDNVNSVIATAPGSFQSELGCSGDWQPWCLRSWLQDPDGDGIFSFVTSKLPAGDYEVKVAHDEDWAENYGAGGVPGGPNIPFNVPANCAATSFDYELATNVLTVGPAPAPAQPASVTIPGSFQEELGCPGDWQPWCAVTDLAFDPDDNKWQGTFPIPAGDWEYKAALNGAWDENYGANATPGGANIGLSLGAATDVKFYFDRATNWVWDNQNKVIATLAGSFQGELGCPGDWQPWCLRSMLQDPDGDGIYTFSTGKLPAGDYEVKVAHNESWDENYGDGGVPGGANIPFSVPADCTEIFFTYDPVTHVLDIGQEAGGPVGNLNQAKSHWVTADLIAAHEWEAGYTAALHYAPDGGLSIDETGVIGGMSVPLTDAGALPASVTDKFRHLGGMAALQINSADLGMVPEMLKGQVALSIADDAGNPVDATSLQIAGVLDDLYTYDGDLGPVFHGDSPTITLWAPTAKNVTLHLFEDSDPDAAASAFVPMMFDPLTGVWSCAGDASWNGKYYLFEVEVYVPSTGQVEHNFVTDPYSLGLSMNSLRSQIVNLDDAGLKPAGWDSYVKPELAAPEDIVIYELHVRDFSIYDKSAPDAYRGTYMAFADDSWDGTKHLQALAEAGLTHLHLLPTFDIASIEEDVDARAEPDPSVLASYPSDSDQQQSLIEVTKDIDGFNWGYDPFHYTVPEGSYSTNPDGPTRIVEYREMVKAVNEDGLRVVMDVVYNHTNASGQNPKSVLDKVVPGYYHRLNANGEIERSTCCENTASEHAMMEKLMIDSLVTWARDYKVDGFRFDLMGHHSKSTMLKIRAALDALTPEADGVDGSSIYLYGEGWNFGEVADNARFEQATQVNMAGTGIGTFSDRLRDGVRGGNPFSDLREQGFVNGLGYDQSAFEVGDGGDDYGELRHISDWIRIGLAGDIADYMLVESNGNLVRADQVDYFGQQAGYTADPQENITYAAAHDNETLFDATQLKAPQMTSMADRVRIQSLANSLVMLGQGIPFFHAGQDILRSKSMDRDSFNSGDWFNAIDWSLQTTNWGNGLPNAEKNQDKWPIMQPLLADLALSPQGADVFQSAEQFIELLQIRKSSGLFRLPTGDDVKGRVAFHNTGPGQVPGLIVMSINDDYGDIDLTTELVVTLFNAAVDDVSFTVPELAGLKLNLHPVQAMSVDPVVQSASFDAATATFSVPARTTAVFVAERPVAEQIDVIMDKVRELRDAGVLRGWSAYSLLAKLKIAKWGAVKDRPKLTVLALRSFAFHVRLLMHRGRLPVDDGEMLLAMTEEVLGSVRW